ncbi:MAG TPA: tetratricopeptide repeat protein [Bryobacteraceae bacterium]|nr:tetratricopeptide repeat protein [Bryobacteraceae bacterium]
MPPNSVSQGCDVLRVAFLAVALALDPAGQEQELIRRTERNPNSAEAHHALGMFYFRTGRYDSATRSFERAADLAPSNALYWKMLGAAYAAQSQFELAEAPLRKACELDPKLEGACYYYGRNLYTENRFEPAVQAFERALRYGPRESRWLVERGLGLALAALGRDKEAEKSFLNAIRSAPAGLREIDDPRLDYAVFLIHQGRHEEARAPLKDHLSRFPNSSRGHFELARVLFHEGRLEEAASHLQKAVHADPQHWAAHLLLGRVYVRLGRNVEGERHLLIGRQGATTTEPVR